MYEDHQHNLWPALRTVIQQALTIKNLVGTFAAARFLRHNGLSLEAALEILK